MSDTLYNYLNNEIKLSQKVISFDKDFKNGFLFGEILSKTGHLIPNDLSMFNKEAKTNQEIKQNFTVLKEHLKHIGIHLDNFTINSLVNNIKGSSASLLYKIKTQIERKNMNFDDIMNKINKYENDEKKEELKDLSFNKSSYRARTKSNFYDNKLKDITYMSTFYGTKSNFNMVKPLVPSNYSNTEGNINLTFNEKNKFAKDRILNAKKTFKDKLKPISPLDLNFPKIPKKTKIIKKDLIKFQIDSKNRISEEESQNSAYDSKLYQQQQKKFKSHGKNDKKMKLFSEKYFENNNEFIKYSCFDRNALKIGIDIKEVDPKLHKQGIGYNNDYIPREVVYSRLKERVNRKEEEIRKKMEEKKFMTQEERYLKNSILSQNQKNESGKKFQINFNKDTQLYKMHEYEKYRKMAFPFEEKINKDLLYIPDNDEGGKENEKDKENKGMEKANSTNMDKFFTKTIMTNFGKEYNDYKQNYYNKYNLEFNEERFFEALGKESLDERIQNGKKKRAIREKNYDYIKDLTNLIIDLTDEFYYYQNKQNVELVDIPDYKNIMNNFIRGKVIFTRQNKNRDSLVNLEDDALINEDEENDEIYNDERYISEYNDYINFRGYWEEKKFIPKNFYGSQLQVYQVLGDEINRLTSSGKIVTQGIKQSILMAMKNEEFELKESEKDNIILPKNNAKNTLFGEIIELNFDNLANNFNMNNINNNLGITNLKKSESKNKLLNNKKNYLNQDITFNSNVNIEDTTYSNNKDFLINSPNSKLEQNNIIINNELNISEVKQEGNKSNNSIDETSLNNNINNTNINNTNINNTNINNPNNTNINKNNNNNSEKDFSYVPIKMCLIGHSFSGRKTQAKLLCEKYPNLKYYSLEKMLDNYFSEYERLHTPIENNPKLKNAKKNQLEQLKNQRIEELKQYEDVFKIIEPFTKDNKKDKDLTDEAKIELLVLQLKKDFPPKEGDLYADVIRRNTRKQDIEQELERIKEEAEKKKKYGAKEIKEQQLLEKELEDLKKEGFSGFILVDFPNTYSQYIKFENILTGFVQQIDKEENLRDKYLELLTFPIDKPYANISTLCPEVVNFLGHGKNLLFKSFFNNYIWLEIDEEETLKRVNDRLIDETTNIIYHKEFNPPPAGDKKLLERLKPVTEPSEECIKEELQKYDIEFPKILSYLSLFHNLKKISKINQNEVLEDINEILSNAVKKFEDREFKDEIVSLNNFDPDESENIKYFKKLNEVKKKVSKEISGNIISIWSESINLYSKGVKQFLYNISALKNNILEKMDLMQNVFYQYLNSKTQKKRLVEIFQRKYEVFFDKYNYLKKKTFVKKEFQKDVIELTEHFWEIIQMKKRDAISEIKKLKEQQFIENQSELFWKYLSKLFLSETDYYVKKLNLIRKYYYEFEGNKTSEKCPYEYTLNENDLLKDLNNFALFNNNHGEGKEKQKNNKNKSNSNSNSNSNSGNKMKANESQNKLISPRIDKIFKNCFKFLFIYDKKINEIVQKEKEIYALNTSNISQISKRKHRGKKSNVADGVSIYSESKILISYEDEMKAALNNEKIKYKIRISLLKFFGEQFLIEAYNISEKTFENLDESIIKSVDAQNTAMNEVMAKIRSDILEGHNKITYNIEMDIFDIYQILNIPFKEFILNFFNDFEDKDKKIDITELNKIYLDLKNYEIQDNYVTLDSVIDIVFKKHLFEFKSKAFARYLTKLPFHYLNNFIKNFIYKTAAGQNLIRIDKLFTILAILNFSPPNASQKKEMMDNASNKLKFHCFLSKEDYMSVLLWYEKKENKNENINTNSIYNGKVNISTNVIQEEKHEENLYKDIDTNVKAENNNDLMLKNMKSDEININNETRQQMNLLYRNLTAKSPVRIRSRKTTKKITQKSSSTNKAMVSEETKLKDFLFNINKNYDNQINFVEFMNVISLKFITKSKNQKKKSIKNFNKNLLLKMAKEGKLPEIIKTKSKKNIVQRRISQFIPIKGGKYEDIYHRSSTIGFNNALINDKKNVEKEKLNQIYIGGDSEFEIFREGDFLIINGKKYKIDSFKENIYLDMTYLDELIEDN